MLFPASKRLIAANTILGFLATTAVTLRLVARKKKKMPLAADDYTIIAAWVIALSISIEGIYTGATNIFILIPPTREKSMTRNKILWIDVFLCHFVYGLIKISILLFYKRLFDTKRFRFVANIFMAMVIAWMLAAIFAQIFSVLPVDTWWNTNGIAKTTFDYQRWLLVMAIIDIVLDVVTLALAFPVIKSLNMRTRRKVSLGCVFALGLLYVPSSHMSGRTNKSYTASFRSPNYKVRLALFLSQYSAKIKGTLVWIDIWGHIEASASIVTACLPSIAPLVTNIKAPESIVHGFRSLSSLTSPSRFSIGKGSRISRESQPSVSERPFRPGLSTYHVSTQSFSQDTDVDRRSDVEAQRSQPDSIIVKKTFNIHAESSSFHDSVN